MRGLRIGSESNVFTMAKKSAELAPGTLVECNFIIEYTWRVVHLLRDVTIQLICWFIMTYKELHVQSHMWS